MVGMVLMDLLVPLETRVAVVGRGFPETQGCQGRQVCRDTPALLVMMGSLELTEPTELMGHPATEEIS